MRDRVVVAWLILRLVNIQAKTSQSVKNKCSTLPKTSFVS